MSLLDDAIKIINTHNYPICKKCKKASSHKRKCREYCLPVEMFVQLIKESDITILELIDNIRYLFQDKEAPDGK